MSWAASFQWCRRNTAAHEGRRPFSRSVDPLRHSELPLPRLDGVQPGCHGFWKSVHLVICSSNAARAPNSCVVTIVYTTEACGDRSTKAGRVRLTQRISCIGPYSVHLSTDENFKSLAVLPRLHRTTTCLGGPAVARKVKRTGRRWAGGQVGRAGGQTEDSRAGRAGAASRVYSNRM